MLKLKPRAMWLKLFLNIWIKTTEYQLLKELSYLLHEKYLKQIYFGNVFQNIFSDFWFPNCIKIFFKKFELSVVKAVFEALFSEQDSCQLFRKNKAWKVRAVNCC